ncbi:ABC transporter permease [Nesterenkonia jeotgali]|uniref:Peptide/nickel transport system permease protein n=1 Tax=Nesterenkonia jeotgali TaxID=317018 RepID=A0A839FHZ9_9MICC|nr:ABC transporter permease [Nesterenkonia jeotgali]MBA8921398.1 peptide/nickel transport system permease protein [Nesterenkonia jeotgali]
MSQSTPPIPPEDVRSAAEAEDAKLASAQRSYSQGQLVRRRFFAHKPAVVSMAVLVFIILISITSIGFSGQGTGWWSKSFLSTGLTVDGGRPTMFNDGFLGEHPFGQDSIGRDYFAMVMRGTQQSLLVAIGVALSSTFLGVLVGALAGYFRGWVEAVLMRITDVVIVVPLLALAAVFGAYAQGLPGGTLTLALAIGLATWTGTARLVRAEILSLREKEYVSAAVAMGSHPARIILKHMLPNSIGVIVVNATFAIAAAILLETTLSYLGFGVQAPETSLGALIQNNQNAFTTRPWLFWFPGLFIIAIALSVNFIGDGLRDAIDPRQKRTGASRPGWRTAFGLLGRSAAEERSGKQVSELSGGPTQMQPPAGMADHGPDFGHDPTDEKKRDS